MTSVLRIARSGADMTIHVRSEKGRAVDSDGAALIMSGIATMAAFAVMVEWCSR
jgi:hypothetical protein